jgi:hypothetical protein
MHQPCCDNVDLYSRCDSSVFSNSEFLLYLDLLLVDMVDGEF